MRCISAETTVGKLVRAVSARALFDTLARLERNMHKHAHKQNTVLLPRAPGNPA